MMKNRNRKRKFQLKCNNQILVEKIPLIKSPVINNFDDLVALGKSDILRMNKGENIAKYSNINSDMLHKITPHLIELSKMIGMKTTKETIFYQVIYFLQDMHKKRKINSDIIAGNYLHTMICGKPGSGKTELAKIIGKIYQSAEIINDQKSNAEFKIAHRDDLIGKYVGHTAIKTRKLLESCLGGVLFIDEAYSISGDVFTKEAVDTLTAFLSENKDNFCCIIAGYEDEIRKSLFGANEGLERRFPWVHKVDEYNSSDLTEIFKQMIENIGWEITDLKIINSAISENKSLFKYNGGSIETFIDKMKVIHAKRVINLDVSSRFIFTDEDVAETIDFMNKTMEHEDTSYLRMYL